VSGFGNRRPNGHPHRGRRVDNERHSAWPEHVVAVLAAVSFSASDSLRDLREGAGGRSDE
jgi:hypothetical protein